MIAVAYPAGFDETTVSGTLIGLMNFCAVKNEQHCLTITKCEVPVAGAGARLASLHLRREMGGHKSVTTRTCIWRGMDSSCRRQLPMILLVLLTGARKHTVRERRGAARQKGEGGLRELAGALGMALASIPELVRKKRRTCPAHLTRLDGIPARSHRRMKFAALSC